MTTKNKNFKCTENFVSSFKEQKGYFRREKIQY